jgi:hypothetical protein
MGFGQVQEVAEEKPAQPPPVKPPPKSFWA